MPRKRLTQSEIRRGRQYWISGERVTVSQVNRICFEDGTVIGDVYLEGRGELLPPKDLAKFARTATRALGDTKCSA